MKRNHIIILLSFISITSISCKKNKNINAGNDHKFKIVANNDSGLKKYNRKVVVFGIDIYAASKVEDAKLLHSANLMANLP